MNHHDRHQTVHYWALNFTMEFFVVQFLNLVRKETANFHEILDFYFNMKGNNA